MQCIVLLCSAYARDLTDMFRWRSFLHDNTYFATAQKKYAYIYDRDGVELHCLKKHGRPAKLEFLPHHFLLATTVRTLNRRHLRYCTVTDCRASTKCYRPKQEA